MLQPEGNQAFEYPKLNRALCGREIQLEHTGDFLLGVTVDAVEPAGTRGVVQARFIVVGCCHQTLPVLSPKIRHSPEHTIGPRLTKNRFAVARSIVAASDKSPNRHASRFACLYAADAVLDYQRTTRIRLHPFG